MRGAEAELAPRLLKLLALPPLEAGVASSLARRLSQRLRLPVQVEALALAREPAQVPGRGQWDARLLLEDLAERASDPTELWLGVSAHDLAVPVFSFVFGLARERVALVSLARLDPAFYGLPSDRALMLRRSLGEALHELGHLAGLSHCPKPECLMRFAATADKADARGQAFCHDCRGRLPAWFAPPAAWLRP